MRRTPIVRRRRTSFESTTRFPRLKQRRARDLITVAVRRVAARTTTASRSGLTVVWVRLRVTRRRRTRPVDRLRSVGTRRPRRLANTRDGRRPIRARRRTNTARRRRLTVRAVAAARAHTSHGLRAVSARSRRSCARPVDGRRPVGAIAVRRCADATSGKRTIRARLRRAAARARTTVARRMTRRRLARVPNSDLPRPATRTTRRSSRIDVHRRRP